METDPDLEDQEQARRRSERVWASLRPLLDLSGETEGGGIVVHHPNHSNDLLEVRFGERRLMVKRGVESWSSQSFRGARRAATLLRKASNLAVPEYLNLPDEVAGWPVLAWWRIERPTLEVVWSGLTPGQRREALRSCGRMLREMHEVAAPAWGPLSRSRAEATEGQEGFMEADLAGRLRPAAAGMWSEGLPLVDRLLDRLSVVADGAPGPRFVHGDPHLSNILCRRERQSVWCIGVLDLDAAMGGSPEVDLAYMELVHSPLMAGDLGRGWMDAVLEGYGRKPDRERMRFFRVYHVLNIGIHAAMNDWRKYAATLAEVGRETLAR